VLALSAGGCRRAGHPLRVLVRNKGSFGHETKVLYLTPSTEHLLHRYIHADATVCCRRVDRQRWADILGQIFRGFWWPVHHKRSSGAPERPLLRPSALETPAELQPELGHR
jgi:hypothetical protein